MSDARNRRVGDFVETEYLLSDFLNCSFSARRDRFLDTRSAARLTGLSRRTIQWWIECGLVAAVMGGRKYQIDRESLVAHLESLAQGLETS